MAAPALSTAQRRLLQRLRRRRARVEAGVFVVEGVRVVEELLRAGIVPRFAVATSTLGDTERGAFLRLALEAVTDVYEASEQELARLADTASPQGVIVVAPTPAGVPDTLALPEECCVLVLDGVQDPGNFGALVRSAVAFAAAAVLALPGTVDPWNPKAVRAAAGTSFRVPLFGMTAEAALDWLRRRGFRIYAAALDGEPLPDVEPAARVALVVGNEGAGLREPFASAADTHVTIPLPGRIESLNVAVAAGILLHAFSSARR